MKVCLVWPECTMSNGEWHHKPITAFWIAATEEEARKFFVDKLSEAHLEEFEKACKDENYLDGWYRGHRDYDVLLERDKDGTVRFGVTNNPPNDSSLRFLVTQDVSRVDLGFAVYPYSGMWNGRSPFKKLEAEITSPGELKDLL